MQLLTVCMHLLWRILPSISRHLVTLYKEARDTLTMCTPEEFDEKYQQYTDDFNDAGFADITEERKAAFEDGNTTRLPEAQKAAE